MCDPLLELVLWVADRSFDPGVLRPAAEIAPLAKGSFGPPESIGHFLRREHSSHVRASFVRHVRARMLIVRRAYCYHRLMPTERSYSVVMSHVLKPIGGRPDTLALAQPLPGNEAWTVQLAFRVRGGRTDLIAHAVIPTPKGWPEHVTDKQVDDEGNLSRPWLELRTWLTDWVESLEEPPGRLTTAVVRSAMTGELERHARRLIASWSDRGFLFPKGAAGHPTGRPRGASGNGDRFFAELAARYVQLSAETDKAVEALAAEMGAKVSTTRNRIFRAREKGLLTSPGQGRTGGELTERAVNLLRGEHDGEH